MTDTTAPDLHESLRDAASMAIEGIEILRTMKKAPLLRLACAIELARALGLPEQEFVAIVEHAVKSDVKVRR